MVTGADPVFFCRRGYTGLLLYFNTNKPLSFFCRIPVVLENRRSSRGGGGVRTPCTLPLYPPLGKPCSIAFSTFSTRFPAMMQTCKLDVFVARFTVAQLIIVVLYISIQILLSATVDSWDHQYFTSITLFCKFPRRLCTNKTWKWQIRSFLLNLNGVVINLFYRIDLSSTYAANRLFLRSS